MTLDIKEKEMSHERGFSQLTALSFPDAAMGSQEDGDPGTTGCKAEHLRKERGTDGRVGPCFSVLSASLPFN